MTSKTTNNPDAKQRAARSFEKLEQRSREAEQRISEQQKADVAAAAKIKRLRALRLARDEAEAAEAAQVAAIAAETPKPKSRAKAKPAT
ncbi:MULTISPECIES: hypothetical protein [unclassified Alsobacter]|jgi:hypothetical protein|uniref:Transcriptional regulator n=1 Tax=Alsobacter sp. KACC 23698 TaxID=3149229 RepID=A0AAU7JMB8_9HYPH